ncbi:MAG: prolyl oligopeptidase family serine peptidase [Nitrospiraceae bacterium]|nr:prolyl oligopeptidase family serine peptidase [Nitrospiraceae bacterium]
MRIWRGLLIVAIVGCGMNAFGEENTAERANVSVRPVLKSAGEARVWQADTRAKLFELLKMSDLVEREEPAPLDVEVLSSDFRDNFTLQEIEISSTPGRRIRIKVGFPNSVSGKAPGVVCIGGHGSTRNSPHDQADDSPYHAFGSALAEAGYVTVSPDVSQHEVYEDGRTLMGERLWDVMRCIDYLLARPDIDAGRIGCAGLSLGGEMAMWLGAMDTRCAATVSCGFLTVMDHMEQNHCMCWKLPGLRGLVDFPDIYALTAPRPLQCQNGLKEPETQFNVPLARQALEPIKEVYTLFGKPENVALHVHEGGHEVDVAALVSFMDEHLGRAKTDQD